MKENHNKKIIIIKSIFKGIGQIMLQNNVYSGLIFLLGISYNSWILGIFALLGSAIGTLTAYIFKYSKDDIENGLYGFNSSLISVALPFFFGVNSIIIFSLIIGSIFSTILMKYLKEKIPPFTAPFVIITWTLLLVLQLFFNQKILINIPSSDNIINIFNSISNSFGQIIFQENIITGLIFFIGIAINLPLSAFYSLYSALLSLLIGLFLQIPYNSLNSGIMGYNAILSVIALITNKKIDILWISLVTFISVILNIGLAKSGITTLTAPFIISTWIILFIKKSIENKK